MVGEQISIKCSCRALRVSRSGYYAWIKRPESERKKQNDILTSEMKKIHEESRRTYGLPRIKEKLKSLGKSCGKERIRTLMKKAGISGLNKRRFKIKTTDSNHSSPIAERVFKTEQPVTHPEKKNSVWASDITYVPTDEGFLFLAMYLDLFTRKLVGFATDEHMRTELILSALDMALGRQNLIHGELVNHSDRGSQYASEAYRMKLESLGVTASMSRKGNCYDNAFAESFFATLKKELIYRNHYKTKEEAKKAVFEYIEVWYNRQRIHSSIGYMTPVQFEESLAA
jgi:putative transposase